jgi:putative ABC transport system substrate-binding protein
MRRRQFVVAAGSLVLSWSGAGAQNRQAVPRIAVLDWDPASASRLGPFRQALRELGYVEGGNLLVDYHYADARLDRASELAAEIVRSRVDVIVAFATPAASAAKNATSTIPIVIGSADPVAAGLVSNIARPGGNVTGVSNMMPDLEAKRLGLVREIFPRLKRIAFLGARGDPATPGFVREAEAAAKRAAMQLRPVLIGKIDEVEEAVSAMKRDGVEAVIVQPLFVLNAKNASTVAQIALRHGMPTITSWALLPRAGGLMSYGPEADFSRRAAARYVDRILKGAAPGDLPIEQPSRFELAINLKTAKALGVTIAPTLLARADEVIE